MLINVAADDVPNLTDFGQRFAEISAKKLLVQFVKNAINSQIYNNKLEALVRVHISAK